MDTNEDELLNMRPLTSAVRPLGVFSHQPIRTQCLQRCYAGSTHQIGHQKATTEHQLNAGGMLEAGPSVWLRQAERKYYKTRNRPQLPGSPLSPLSPIRVSPASSVDAGE